MKDSIYLDGKKYISSSRAAEMAKYSKDYIGQLCRTRKIEARMMGRTWYVDEGSLLDHKKQADLILHPVQALPNIGSSVVNMIHSASVTDESLAEAIPSRTLRASSTRTVIVSAISIACIIIFASFGYLKYRDRNQGISAQVSRSTEEANTANALSSLQDPNVVDQAQAEQVSGQGAVVAPELSADASSTSAATDRIKNQFSDTVTVHPDESGFAGVVTPLFKSTKGNDYLYVLVPVKQNSQSPP
jgi:hypothetical protein